MNIKYRIVQTGKFKRDLKLIRKRGYDLSLLGVVVDMLYEKEGGHIGYT